MRNTRDKYEVSQGLGTETRTGNHPNRATTLIGQVRRLTNSLERAERRAHKAEDQHAEDLVRIESWSTMADALATNGDETQSRVAQAWQRVTGLRVREMTLARQASTSASM